MAAGKKSGTRLDLATVGGIAIALLALVGGLLLEGGSLRDVAQATALLIVLGGTAGAVMVHTPLDTVRRSVFALRDVFLDTNCPLGPVVDELVDWASRARRGGLVSLEQDAAAVADPFLQKALTLAVDGADVQEIRRMLELEMDLHEAHRDEEAKVFESAGGYAPTIGIIGAVMGLIQVMKHLEDIREVGHGIAVAFVATVYGVAFSNLAFLPAASKIRARNHRERERRELIMEGVLGIVEGLNPKMLRSKLEAYAAPSVPTKPSVAARAKAA